MKVTFEGDEQTLTLFEAAIWIGGKGWNLSEEQTAALFKSGVAELFQTLASGRLAANGIRRETQLREDIPNSYWERAEELPELSEKRHSVSFIEDADTVQDNSGFGGSLTPYGDHSPRWVDIRVDGHAIRSIYPFGWRKRRLTPEESQARDEIIGRAMRGEITPSEADDEALRRIGEPIETPPDPSNFRPEREPWWTLTMALAWIVRRDLETVRCYWNDYRRECCEWRSSTVGRGTPSQQSGWVIEPLGSISLSDAIFYLAFETSEREWGMPIVAVSNAENQLLLQLRSGQLIAFAESHGDRSQVPDHAWINVNLSNIDHRFSEEPWVRSADVRTIWKATGHTKPDRRAPHRPRTQRDAAISALRELYPAAGGNPGAEKVIAVFWAVNQWLRKNGQTEVSRRTVERAITDIRIEDS